MARRTAKISPEVFDHLQWLGYAQPTGLVVSAPALVARGAVLNRNHAEAQRKLVTATVETALGLSDHPVTYLPDFRRFAESVLGWQMSSKWYVGTDAHPVPDSLKVPLPDEGDLLEPTFAVRTRSAEDTDEQPQFQLLVKTVGPQTDLDKAVPGTTRKSHGLEASPHSKMERLLRATDITAGVLFNGHVIRLISAPRGESSGWLDFRVADMVQTPGRPLCSALDLLLSQSRLLTGDVNSRLPALLEESRKYQNTVSEKLAEQVLHALYELVRGFHAANVQSGSELLKDVLAKDPDAIYHGLVTVILRMVFVLYAEERNLLPTDEAFVNHYSIGGLYDRLRQDASQYPDTMDHRYGAWPQLLVLFRMIHDGARCQNLDIPARQGHLFDPDSYPFLESRTGPRKEDERLIFPLIPDGHIHRALEKLLILDGERISYRALDVEQIGSVYETMMGFRIETAQGTSLAIKAAKAHGAPTTINLEALLACAPKKREKWLLGNADRKLTAKQKEPVVAATTLDELQEALDRVIDKQATPDRVPKGALVLQPSDARRRSGSHYTPRSLTQPIVRKTFEPIFKRLEEEAVADGQPGITPDQLLNLKVCDPAMGSGAFLVEACRQLADQLVAAWKRHDCVPTIPPDEDELLYARREIAQRCLYGVDKNPMAVDLAKLSIWLATLARDHAFTFLDHTFRCGDSLVGLSRRQLQEFTWEEPKGRQTNLFGQEITKRVAAALNARNDILHAGDFKSPAVKKQRLAVADQELDTVRRIGNLAIAAFFAGSKAKERSKLREEYLGVLNDHINPATPYKPHETINPLIAKLTEGEQGVIPFHWEIEFPEVFGNDKPGFNAIVGNPPFMGGRKISSAFGLQYFDMLRQSYPPAGNTCDLVAFFFRQAYLLLGQQGCQGLICTNTIAQGDTRHGGLTQIRLQNGLIYHATKRYPWPGQAGVIVSIVHIQRGRQSVPNCILDGKSVKKITAFLFQGGGDEVPKSLGENNGIQSVGSFVYGRGFMFDDSDEQATSISRMRELVKVPRIAERIFPFIGGEEINGRVDHSTQRYVIFLSDIRDENELGQYPELAEIIRNKVKPGRDSLGNNPVNKPLKKRWWAFQAHRPDFYESVAKLPRILATCRVTKHFAVTFVKPGPIFGESVVLFALKDDSSFAIMQSRVHEIWARFFSSTMGDALRYAPTDCFETFPLPAATPELEEIGRKYFETRASLMIENGEGLTKTYNRFHDPDEHHDGILKLRRLHEMMDAAVLRAYGWDALASSARSEFLLDYEEDEVNAADSGSSKKKKPWRYRWPDEIHDNVLACLLELNTERADVKAKASAAAIPAKKSKGRKKKAVSHKPTLPYTLTPKAQTKQGKLRDD